MVDRSVTSEFHSLIEDMGARDRTILFARFIVRPKKTLESIGDQFGLTRERVRQLEKSVKLTLNSWLESNASVSGICDKIIDATGLVSSFSWVMSQVPEAFDEVTVELSPDESLTIPVWQLIQALRGSYESDGEWFYVSNRDEVSQNFSAKFAEAGGELGFVELREIVDLFEGWGSASPEELLAWVQSIGYKIVLGALLSPRVKAMNDLAAVALAIKGVPMTTADLHATIAPSKSVRSLANQMSEDVRLQRVGLESWGLVEWGYEAFSSIRESILARVDSKGSVPLTELIEEITLKFGVAESSVRAYATAWPLKVQEGMVSRHEEKITPRGRPLPRSKGSYVTDEGYAFRTKVTSEHLRGSGSQFPTALAVALGNSIGESIVFRAALTSNPLRLGWNGNQAILSTIRAELESINAQDGDEVAIYFQTPIAVFRKLDAPTGDPFEDLARLCLIPPNTKVGRVSVARSLGLDETSVWDEILQSAVARKDHELEAAVRSVIDRLLNQA